MGDEAATVFLVEGGSFGSTARRGGGPCMAMAMKGGAAEAAGVRALRRRRSGAAALGLARWRSRGGWRWAPAGRRRWRVARPRGGF